MKTKSKTAKASKPSLKVRDLPSAKNPTGGKGKSGSGQKDFLKATMKE